MLEFCTLGTGGTLPIPERALSSLYVRVNGQSLLIDCGEGTQVGIRRLGWGFRCLDGLLLTHYHGDHCTGLAGLLLSLEKAGRDQPFHIWGRKGSNGWWKDFASLCRRFPIPCCFTSCRPREGTQS